MTTKAAGIAVGGVGDVVGDAVGLDVALPLALFDGVALLLDDALELDEVDGLGLGLAVACCATASADTTLSYPRTGIAAGEP